jgi:hypothetical protein
MKISDSIKFEIARFTRSYPTLLSELREQFYFGSREILLEYMNLDIRTILLADIQHGFPRMVRAKHSLLGRGRIPDLVWSDYQNFKNKKGKLETNLKRQIPVGSSWLYMRMNKNLTLKENQEKNSEKSGTLMVVPHSDNFQNLSIDKRFGDYLDLNRVNGILLFNEDFLNPMIRSVAKDRNIEIECAGLPRTYQPQAYMTRAGGRENFLFETYKIFKKYRNLICPNFSTALIYGANAGLNVGILNTWTPKYLCSTATIRSGIAENRSSQWLTEVFPFSLNIIHDSENLSNWANLTLGLDYLKSPEELHQIIPYIENVLPDYILE